MQLWSCLVAGASSPGIADFYQVFFKSTAISINPYVRKYLHTFHKPVREYVVTYTITVTANSGMIPSV